jgi:hypothetical protein
MKIVVDINDSKLAFAMEFFKNVSFIKRAKAIAPNEITNFEVLESIEGYEKGKVKPTPVNLKELKAMIDA